MKKLLQSLLILATPFLFAQNILELNPSNFPITQPVGFTKFNNKLFYVGNNTTYGREMWSTDGSTNGNQLLKDIGNQYNIAALSGFQAQQAFAMYGQVGSINGKLFFNASYTAQFSPTIWLSDGTEAGTTSFNAGIFFIKYFFTFQGRLYFTAYNGTTGTEIWSTDGTVGGTTMLKDINPDSGQSVYSDPGYAILDGKMYFKADDGVHGRELWVTDGTEAGTNMVVDLTVVAAGVPPINTFDISNTDYGLADEHIKVAGGKLFFTGKEGDYTGGNLNYMYVSDGTAAGTLKIPQTINLGILYRTGTGLTVLNNELYFFNGNLLKTDGTEAGTVEVKQIGAEYQGDNGYSDNETSINSMRIFNGKGYFMAGLQLWCTDGTTAGTTQLTNLQYGAFNYQSRLVSQVFDNKLYFVNNGGAYQLNGIYSTDGAVAGTGIAAKGVALNATTAQTTGMTTMPQQLSAFGDSLYFSASYGSGQPSLWRLRNPSLANDNDEKVDLKLRIYPNPTSNILNLEIPSDV